MKGFKYGDSAQYQNSCKNLAVTLIELFVGLFFFLLTVIFVLILGPFPIYDRVQETRYLLN